MYIQYVKLAQKITPGQKMGSFYIPPAALSVRGVEHDSNLASNPHLATNKRSVRTVQFGFSVWIRNAEESGTGRSKTLRNGSRPSSRNMRRLVSAKSIPAGNWGMRPPARLDMSGKRIMGNALFSWSPTSFGMSSAVKSIGRYFVKISRSLVGSLESGTAC